MRLLTILLAALLALTGCAGSGSKGKSGPKKRTVLLSTEYDDVRVGAEASQQTIAAVGLLEDPELTEYVSGIGRKLLRGVPRRGFRYRFYVTDQTEPNAFALPGGKIGIYNGLLDIAVTPPQLASVIAHEVGHVLANHSNERASQAALRNVGLAAAQILGASSSAIEAIDVGSRYGIFLPFNRTQEIEADTIGVMLMARAGFDPEASITLWQNMVVTAGPSPPQLLSTHPSPASRMSELRQLMEPAVAIRNSANSRGINPDCVAPGNNLQF